MTPDDRAQGGMERGGIALPFILVTLIWSSTWIVIRDQLGSVPASWSVCYRFLLAGLAMAAFARMRGVSLNIGRSGLVFAALLGTAQFVLNFNFVYRAEVYLTSGVVAVVYAMLLIPNSILAWIFHRQPVSRASTPAPMNKPPVPAPAERRLTRSGTAGHQAALL